MNDLISKQQAIDAIGEKADEIYKTKQKGSTYPHNDFFQGMAYAADIIKALPPAQPVQCEDAVSRQTLKDGFTEMCNLICPYSKKQQHVMCGSCLMGTAFDVLEATPPVTPKQRTGKWIFTKDYYWICSECGKNPTRGVGYVQGGFELFPHCPYCGSRNEVTT